MIRSTLKKILGRLLGRKTPPPVVRPSPPRQPPARPAPMEVEHDHGHSHSHDHGHDHDHGGGRAEPAPPPAHEDGHDHGHSHEPATHAPEPVAAAEPAPAAPVAEPAAEPKKAKKAVDVTVEETPNPNARKFTVSARVVEKGSLTFSTAEEAEGNPVAKAIFAAGGVSSVFMVKDFVTVTRQESADWTKLAPKVTKAIKKAL